MNMRKQLLALCAVALVSSSESSAAEPLQPTGKWVVDYAADQCLLSRNYGTEDKPITLVFEKLPLTQLVSLYVVTRSKRQDFDSGKAHVMPKGDESDQQGFMAYNVGNGSVRMIAVSGDVGLVRNAAREGTISFDIVGETNASFAVPNLGAAFAALDDCALDLGRTWGIPIDQQRLVATPTRPIEKLGTIFDSDDYPAIAERNGESARIKDRVSVDATGKPTACALSRASGSRTLDEKTCAVLMHRPHYSPALDAQGRPIASMFVTQVAWLIAG
jgi:hypothetical protein